MIRFGNWFFIGGLAATTITLGLFYYYVVSSGTCVSDKELVINPIEGISNSTLHIPINMIIASSENLPILYDEEKIIDHVSFANDVWSKAGISFEIVKTRYVEVPFWRAIPFQLDGDLCRFGKDFIGSEFEDQIVDVIIIKDFMVMDGGITVQRGTIGAAFIEEFDDEYRANWTLAHELGHALNLSHTQGTDNLMFNANVHPGILEIRPVNLSEEQIATARNWAYTVRCPDLSCLTDK